MPLQALTTIPTTSIPTTTTAATAATRSSKADTRVSPPSSLDFHTPLPCQKASLANGIQRRNLISSLGIAAGAVWGLNWGEKNAWAAARRPPPPAAGEQEKKDPNMSAVQAKVLASRKRKEAMKQAMAKQRERGNQVEKQ